MDCWGGQWPPWPPYSYSTATTVHILNGCQEALTQGRFTWRHDSVLNCIISQIKEEIPPSSKLYADLPGLRASESPPATLPTNLSTSTARPDMVLTTESSVTMLELTIPSNSYDAIRKAKKRKTNKPNYSSLIGDLKKRGLSVTYRTLEIGSLGHYLPDAIHCISYSFKLTKAELKKVLQRASTVTIACSYHIFNSRNSASWDTNLFIAYKNVCA